MGQLWNLPGRTALATLAGLAMLEGTTGQLWAAPARSGTAPTPAAAVASSPGRVSVDFVDADLGDVVKALSIQSGVNVVLAADAKGKVTVRLKGTTLEEALRLITSRLDNFDFKKINGAYVLGTTTALRDMVKRVGEIQTLEPRFLSLSDARDVVQTAAPYVDVQVQQRTGRLILTGLREDLAAARAAVETADNSSASAHMTRVITSPRLTPKALADLLKQSVPELQCSVRALGVIVTGSNAQVDQAQRVVDLANQAGGFPQVTRLYPLKYISATTAMAMFAGSTQATSQSSSSSTQPAAGAEGEDSNARSSSLSVSSPSMSLRGGFPHLIVACAPEPQAPPAPSFKPLSVDSSKSFNTTTGTDASVGSGGASAGSAAGGAGGASGVPAASAKVRTLVLMGPEDEVNGAVALLDQLDVAPVQVMIEARVLETSPEALKNIGVQWDFGTSGFSESAHGASKPGVNVGVITRVPLNFTATLNALVQNTNAKILAEPKIAVLDGEDASIFIGDTVRYQTLSGVSTGGQQTFTVNEVPVGIVLLVRPRVNADGMITLKVNPVVSSITAFIGPQQLPQTASREANSTIRVHDGDTIAIGGLIQDQDRQTFSKVPILGDLPLVGQLFRSNNHDRKRTDVTIFLTTHLLKG